MGNMTAANKITLSRIALIPLFMLTVYLRLPSSDIIALAIFAVASLTDGVDGYVARKYNQVTNLGKFMDPLADKLLVASAILIFVQRGDMSSAAAMMIIAREFIVTSLRIVAVSENIIIAAGAWGKAKTFIQILVIIFLFTPYAKVPISPLKDTVNLFGVFPFEVPTLGRISIWIMVIITVWSGIVYIYQNKQIFKSKEAN